MSPYIPISSREHISKDIIENKWKLFNFKYNFYVILFSFPIFFLVFYLSIHIALSFNSMGDNIIYLGNIDAVSAIFSLLFLIPLYIYAYKEGMKKHMMFTSFLVLPNAGTLPVKEWIEELIKDSGEYFDEIDIKEYPKRVVFRLENSLKIYTSAYGNYIDVWIGPKTAENEMYIEEWKKKISEMFRKKLDSEL